MSSRSLLASVETIPEHRFVTFVHPSMYMVVMVIHHPTKSAVCQVIPQLHLLEQVASAEHIGTTAENLLEAMMSHPDCEAKVCG